MLEQQSGTSVLTPTGAVDHGDGHAIATLHDALEQHGHPAELVDPHRARARWPGLRVEWDVLFHPDAGRVHADRAVRAFHTAGRELGVVVRTGERAVRVVPADGRVDVVLNSGAHLAAGAVVVAAGAWSAAVLDGVVDGLPPLRVTQEQPVHFPSALPADSWPSFIHHRGAGESGIYGLGGDDGVKVGEHAVGPVVDPDHRDRTTEPEALRRVQDYAARWLPGVDVTRPSASTCLYTSTPDSDFVVDRQGPVTVLAGFSGHGFKFAPAIGELAAGLVLDGTPALPRFALGRHTTTTDEGAA